MRASRTEVIEHAPQVGGEIAEVERAFVVVAVAIAARIPCDRMKVPAECGELIAPVGTIPPDSVQEDRQRPGADTFDGDPRCSRHHHFLRLCHSSSSAYRIR